MAAQKRPIGAGGDYCIEQRGSLDGAEAQPNSYFRMDTT